MKKRKLSIFLTLVMMLSLAALAFAVDTPYADSVFFTDGDYELHYRIAEHEGDFQGRIMMLHGFMCSTYAWRNMTAELTKAGYDCVMVDLPNFGYSTRETPEMVHQDREKLVQTLMNYLAPDEKWILAGHSMGGGVVVNIAEENNNVEALLLYCPAVQSTAPASMRKIIASKPMQAMMNLFFKVGTKLNPVVRLVVYAATNNWQFAKDYDLSGVTAPFLYDGIGGGMCTMITSVRPTNLADAEKITVPVLLCNADHDVILDKNSKSAFENALPHAETYIVQGGGHQCIEDRAEELGAITVEFLQK